MPDTLQKQVGIECGLFLAVGFPLTAAIPVESDPGPVIGGVVAGVLIIVILVLAVVLYRHWQRRPNMYKKEDHELHEDLRVKRNSSRRTKTR